MLKKMRKHKYKYKLILMNEKNSLLSYDIYLKKKRKKTLIFLFFLLI